MNLYGQFCPLAQAAQLLCERWTLLIVREMVAGSTRFNEIKKGVPKMSPSLFSARLKQLVTAGVIEKSGGKGSPVYSLSPAGLALRPIVELLGAWGHRWAPSKLNKIDLDAGLLMWDMRRTVDTAIFPMRRIVVQFEYLDAPKAARDWWLVAEKGEIDLCLNDQGFDVDIMITCSLKAMTEVWVCQKRFRDAVRNGDIKVTGDSKLIDKLQDWLRSSPLSRLGASAHLPELVSNSKG